ncbi:MAG: ABC transporter ATP-binding protein [Arachnia sp.]
MTALIEIDDVTVRFGADVVALNRCSLTVDEGEFVAVTGPSGSGKSTLLNIIGLLDQPTSGSYVLAGEAVAGLDDRGRAAKRSRDIGFVFQSFHLIGHRTVHENVALGALYQHLPLAERAAEADKHIHQVGLAHRRGARAGTLSGGECQRVALARALMGSPKLLLCDEPTGNLDSANTEAILDLLTRLNEDGMTVVIITHENDVAARAGRQVVLRDGAVSASILAGAS